jgi:hypothetical protein
LGIIINHLDLEDLLTLRCTNKYLYTLIGSVHAANLERKLADRCITITAKNGSRSIDKFVMDITWAFEGIHSPQSNGMGDFEPNPLPFSNFRLRVLEKSTFDRSATSTFLDRYGSSIQRLSIDKFWGCLQPPCSEAIDWGEKTFYSKLGFLKHLSITKVQVSDRQQRTTTQIVEDCFPESLTKNLESLFVRSEDTGKEVTSLVMKWFSKAERLENFGIPEVVYLSVEDNNEEYCHDDKALLHAFLVACWARDKSGFPSLKLLDLAEMKWNDDSIQNHTDNDWVSFERWMLERSRSGQNHPCFYLAHVNCGFFTLLSPSPGNSLTRSVADIVLSLSSVNENVLQFSFPRLNALNLFSGDSEWKRRRNGPTATYQEQSMWQNLESVLIYSEKVENYTEVEERSIFFNKN